MSAVASAHNPILIGHDEAMHQITEAFASGRMHHAWLIAGIEGIGKTTLAYHIADHVLSSGQNPLGRLDLQHRITKLVMNEAHPDMLVVRRAADEKTGELRNVIVVDDALKIATFLHKTATHGGWRIVIVDEAHTLNRHGQNAILKILEEPPARTLILMTVTTPGALLPTIRSRCRVMHLAPLDNNHVKTILSRTAPELSSDDLDKLIDLAGGSIGFALKIVHSEALPLYEELAAIIDGMPALDIPRLHKLADQISRKADSESFEVVVALLLERLRNDVATKAEQGARRALIEPRMEVWEKVRNIFTTAAIGNLDRKLAFIQAVTEIKNSIIPM